MTKATDSDSVNKRTLHTITNQLQMQKKAIFLYVLYQNCLPKQNSK